MLTHWDELTLQLSLDGTLVSRDESWREETREIYMRGVLKGLNEKCSGFVSQWEFSADFAVILKHADSLEGPGWYRFREWSEAVVFFDFGCGSLTEDTVAERQYTTPKLKAQKRLWADVMSSEFLHKAAAPNIHKSTLELLELWRLKASTVFNDQSFNAFEDIQNAALNAIWVAVVGEEPGVTRHETEKLQSQVAGMEGVQKTPHRGAFLKEEILYVGDAIARNSNTPVPKWGQKFETYTPRFRKFRRVVNTEIGLVMKRAVHRFQRLEVGKLESEAFGTCMMDLVLRRQVLEAKKSKHIMTDPTKDQNMLDEMFNLDSTANALTWFVKFMGMYPAVQNELRRNLMAALSSKEPSIESILGTDIPYLDATCDEGFRLSGVAKGNLRQAIVDTEILGCKIPKGAEIFMNYHINQAPVDVDESKRTPSSKAAASKFGDGIHGTPGRDPGAFEPRRWLVTNEKTGAEAFNPYALPSLAYGGGYRGCTERKLAAMEFRIVVTLLILNFKFLDLPEDLKALSATEKIFRQSDKPFVRLEVL
ncbi:hypothetical protein LQW54_005873 [Pestalotiopsis sp. IQ-011]